MADPFIAEIRIFPFNFAPRGWAWCDGQLLPIAQNTALFSLLGTTYGGNGQTTFALPNMQGRAPLQPGQGPGLSLRLLGQVGGTETVTLLQTEMPDHTHNLMAQSTPLGGTTNPTDNSFNRPASGNLYSDATANLVQLSDAALATTGTDQPHNNMMPYLTFYFCIALQGVFPPRP